MAAGRAAGAGDSPGHARLIQPTSASRSPLAEPKSNSQGPITTAAHAITFRSHVGSRLEASPEPFAHQQAVPAAPVWRSLRGRAGTAKVSAEVRGYTCGIRPALPSGDPDAESIDPTNRIADFLPAAGQRQEVRIATDVDAALPTQPDFASDPIYAPLKLGRTGAHFTESNELPPAANGRGCPGHVSRL
jgi:hypothetical protein